MEYSYQLYSSRNFQPWQNACAMLQKSGYTQVEGISALYEDLDQTASMLKQYNLTMPSGHFSLESLERQPEETLKVAQALGIKALYCPHLAADQRPSDAAGYTAFGEKLARIGKPYTDAGLVYGWHNHDFEFEPLADGSMPIDCIFQGGPSLAWEADVAWIARAGANPTEWIDKYGDRIRAVHVKDIATVGECVDEDGWADVGHGTMNWAALMAQVKTTPAEVFVLEHDNPSDDRRFAQRSIATLQQF